MSLLYGGVYGSIPAMVTRAALPDRHALPPIPAPLDGPALPRPGHCPPRPSRLRLRAEEFARLQTAVENSAALLHCVLDGRPPGMADVRQVYAALRDAQAVLCGQGEPAPPV